MNSQVKILGGQISLWGSEDFIFSQYLGDFQSYKLLQHCNISCVLNGNTLRENSSSIFLEKTLGNIVELYESFIGKCPACLVLIKTKIEFNCNPNFIIVQPANQLHMIRYNDLHKEIIIDGRRFKLMCATVLENKDHFVAIFNINGSNFYVNAIGKQCEEMPLYNESIFYSRRLSKLVIPYTLAISTALYYLLW